MSRISLKSKYLLTPLEAIDFFSLNPPDVLVTAGAGDIDRMVSKIEKCIIKKIGMSKWVKITLLLISFIGIIMLLNWSQEKEANKVLLKPDISIQVKGENVFLTESELYARLRLKKYVYNKQIAAKLPVQKIEKFISEMTEVKSVKVYKKHGAKWLIDVVLKSPIARVFDSNNNTYYIDKDGDIIERSSLHTARVILFSGNINDPVPDKKLNLIINNDSLKSKRILDDIYRISNYVCKSPFFDALIGQVYINDKKEFVLIPSIGDQKIIFGTAETEKLVADKFKRLQVFYEQAMPYEGWQKYREISVKYNGQIVCKKR